MTLSVLALVALCLVVGAGVLAVLTAGYWWGKFTASEISHHHREKWRAYVVALVPAAAFALAFHFDRGASSMAGSAFFGLASPAIFGVLYGWNADQA